MTAHGRRLRGRQLGHGRRSGIHLPRILELGGSPRQETRRVPGHRHGTDFRLNRLKVGNRLAKGVAFEGVLDGAVNRGGSNAQSLAGDANATAVECLHGNLKALAGFAEEILFGNADVIENEIGSGGRPNAEFVFLGAEGKAWGVRGDDKGRNALVTMIRNVCEDRSFARVTSQQHTHTHTHRNDLSVVAKITAAPASWAFVIHAFVPFNT